MGRSRFLADESGEELSEEKTENSASELPPSPRRCAAPASSTPGSPRLPTHRRGREEYAAISFEEGVATHIGSVWWCVRSFPKVGKAPPSLWWTAATRSKWRSQGWRFAPASLTETSGWLELRARAARGECCQHATRRRICPSPERLGLGAKFIYAFTGSCTNASRRGGSPTSLQRAKSAPPLANAGREAMSKKQNQKRAGWKATTTKRSRRSDWCVSRQEGSKKHDDIDCLGYQSDQCAFIDRVAAAPQIARICLCVVG